MGYELLTFSPAGLRRRGTGVEELRRLFESSLTVSSVFEPLKCCLVDDDTQHVVAELQRLDFDVAGVLQQESSPVMGWIDRYKAGEGACHQWMRAIDPSQVVSDSTSLSSVVHVLALQPWAFVIAGHGVTGIITRSDLQKPPVRAVLFGLLSLLEMHLAFWINEYFTSEEWRDLLKPERAAMAEALFLKRVERNEEISLLDCLQFCDKKDIVASKSRLRELLELGSKQKARRALERAVDLRDRIAHGQDLVASDSWHNFSKTVLWIERVLATSDAAIELQNR